jgi:hypothetical protein
VAGKLKHLRLSGTLIGLPKFRVRVQICVSFLSSCNQSPNICIVTGKKPSKGKRKHEEDPEEKPAPKTKKQKVKAAPPPLNTSIIHVQDDNDDDDIYYTPAAASIPPTTTTSFLDVPSSSTSTSSMSAGSSLSAPIDVPSMLSQDIDQSTMATAGGSVDSESTVTHAPSSKASPQTTVVLQNINDVNSTSALNTATNVTEQREPGPGPTLQVNHQADEAPQARRSRCQVCSAIEFIPLLTTNNSSFLCLRSNLCVFSLCFRGLN